MSVCLFLCVCVFVCVSCWSESVFFFVFQNLIATWPRVRPRSLLGEERHGDHAHTHTPSSSKSELRGVAPAMFGHEFRKRRRLFCKQHIHSQCGRVSPAVYPFLFRARVGMIVVPIHTPSSSEEGNVWWWQWLCSTPNLRRIDVCSENDLQPDRISPTTSGIREGVIMQVRSSFLFGERECGVGAMAMLERDFL